MMVVDSKAIVRLLSKKQRRSHLGYIGVAIKERRNSLALTQEQITSGLCSVSYLSKLENMKSNINTGFVEDIMNRLNMNYKQIKTILAYTRLLESMQQYVYYSDKEKAKKIFDGVKDGTDAYFNSVLKLMYFILICDVKKIIKEYIALTKIKETIEKEEIPLFLALSFITATIIGEADAANELSGPSLTMTNGWLHYVVLKYSFLLYRKIGRYEAATEMYKRYVDICVSNGNTKDIDVLSKKRAITRFLKDDNCEMNYFTKEEFVCVCAYRLIYSDDMHAIDVLNKYKFVDQAKHAFLLRLMAYYHFKLDLNDVLQHDFPLNKEEKMHYNVYEIYCHYGEESMKSYIKKEVLPYYEQRRDVIKYRFYANMIIDILRQKARYKEIVLIYQKLDQMI